MAIDAHTSMPYAVGESEASTMHLKNKSNEYVNALQGGFYDETPKAVWAALAVSLIEQIHGEVVNDSTFLTRLLLDEWSTLHINGIVPQAPKR